MSIKTMENSLGAGQKSLAAEEAGEREVHAVFGFVCPKKALQQIELPFFIVAQGDLQGAHHPFTWRHLFY